MYEWMTVRVEILSYHMVCTNHLSKTEKLQFSLEHMVLFINIQCIENPWFLTFQGRRTNHEEKIKFSSLKVEEES